MRFRAIRFRFWLLVLDILAACGAWRSRGLCWRLYGWATRKAADATDWGEVPPGQDGNAPW